MPPAAIAHHILAIAKLTTMINPDPFFKKSGDGLHMIVGGMKIALDFGATSILTFRLIKTYTT